MSGLERAIRDQAFELGFRKLGFVDVASHVAELMRPGVERPSALPPRLVVMAYPWSPLEWQMGQAEVSGYYFATNQSYHAASALMDWLLNKGIQAERVPFFQYKIAATLAGLGVIRLNHLLYTPEFGSRVALQVIGVDCDLPPSVPLEGEPCGSCTQCMRACPVGALDGGMALERMRCARAHMMPGEPISQRFRAAMGNRLLGCDLCQAACPRQPTAEKALPPDAHIFQVDRLLSASPETLARLAALLGPNEARKLRVQAQAALVAGNTGDPTYLPLLRELIQSPHAAVAEHAAWAIERIQERHGVLQTE